MTNDEGSTGPVARSAGLAPPARMKALTYRSYGPPEVVRVSEVPTPAVSPDEVLVRVHASAVNSADWRIRAADFPGILALPARLMFGLFRPRNPRLGAEFAGTVEGLGPGVTRFKLGDRVYGIVASGGASAQYLAVGQGAAIALVPEGLSLEEAAGLPFGGLCALSFLSDVARLSPGQRLLVVGASGGVGTYAVQIGKALGAEVTGVAGPDNQAFVASLGADRMIDYSTTPLDRWPVGFDVILDTVGRVSPRQARHLLREGGLFLPLIFGLREIGAALVSGFRRKKIRLAVNEDTAEGLARLSALVTGGSLRPVVGASFPLEEAATAHALVQSRHRRGSVVLRIP